MKNIFLIGLPSSGKSTLGRALAKQLEYHFFDTDQKIELRENMKITEIFSLKGEDHFRKVESEVLRSIPINDKTVVSTGGGSVCFHDGIGVVKRNGFSIFLDVPIETIAARIATHQKNDRPLLTTQSPEKLREELAQKRQERLPFYQQADVTIEGNTDIGVVMDVLRHFGII